MSDQTTQPSRNPSYLSLIPHPSSLVFSLTATGLVFWGCFQLDRPVLASMRTVHVVWLERIGDLFYLLGTGGSLVIISLAFLAAGYVFKDDTLRRCGLLSLIAHGAVALVVQTLKHTIGRPRPRMMREEEFFTGPSFVSGLDSFPSGHAAASFAVATVVACHYPRWSRSAYGLATLVALSRIVRGSHFATDVAVGVTLGLLAGSVVAGSFVEWRLSLTAAIRRLAPSLAVGFAVLWTVSQPVVHPVQDAAMFWAGTAGVAFGVGSRWGTAFRGERAAFLGYARAAIILGLAFATGAWLVVLIAGLILLASRDSQARGFLDHDPDAGTLPQETVLASLLAVGILLLQYLKGALVAL
jgi:membrane-associated phospholipid phosphatase